jgi:hypothetical protein
MPLKILVSDEDCHTRVSYTAPLAASRGGNGLAALKSKLERGVDQRLAT